MCSVIFVCHSQANEERAQAAEYGLVILEEKQALQLQHEELINLYESTKRELENSVNVRIKGGRERGRGSRGGRLGIISTPLWCRSLFTHTAK